MSMVQHTCTDPTGEADEPHLLEGPVVPCWCPIGHDHTHDEFKVWAGEG